jgi:integrase/recombinase XerD
MSWDFYIQQFKNYLKLERSLSENSIEAYIHDVVKLKQFIEISNSNDTPLNLQTSQIQEFLEYLNREI